MENHGMEGSIGRDHRGVRKYVLHLLNLHVKVHVLFSYVRYMPELAFGVFNLYRAL
jgi:hypothetical protein